MADETRNMLLADLVPSDYNPRSITPEAREALRQSIHRFGQASTLTWNIRTGNLVGGHQRAAIMREEGLERANVSVVDLSLEDEKTLNIALNSQRLAGKFDDQKLSEMLEEIKSFGSDAFLQLRMNEMIPEKPRIDLGREILDETEYQALEIDIEAIIGSLSEKIRAIAENYPDKLLRAFSLIMPLHGGRRFFLLIDPDTTQTAAELIRYAEEGKAHPLECLFSAMLPFKKQ